MCVELRRVRGLLLDLDGTLYVSGRPLPGSAELVRAIDETGRSFVCLTNNSSARGRDYASKLAAMGLSVVPRQVLTSGQATIYHLLHHTPYRSAFVLGTDALRQEFADSGIELDEAHPDCVVVGYDTTLDYGKLSTATQLLFAGKPYFATHPDRTCISEDGLLPDIAAIIAGLAAVTGREPLILGKPERAMVDAGAARLGLPSASLAMVGDQLDTDITMARSHGLLGILVLSGETSAERLSSSAVQPDIVLDHVGQLAELLRDARLEA